MHKLWIWIVCSFYKYFLVLNDSVAELLALQREKNKFQNLWLCLERVRMHSNVVETGLTNVLEHNLTMQRYLVNAVLNMYPSEENNSPEYGSTPQNFNSHSQ